MKKIKGGKRVGAGRKKTGKTTEVISFSVPKNLVSDIKELVKERLGKKPKSGKEGIPLPTDYVNLNGQVSAINKKGEVVIPDLAAQIKNDNTNKRISELRNELKTPPKNPLIGLRNWIRVRENDIKKLENDLL